MSIALVTPPGEEPVTVAEVKAAARIETDAEDAYLTGLISAARQVAENEIAGKLIEQTWDLYLDAFPAAEIEIPAPLRPLRSVVSVTYLDAAGVGQTVSASDYTVDTHQPTGWLIPDDAFYWPDTYAGANAVRVRVTVGYAADAAGVDAAVKLWLKAMAAHWYDSRAAASDRPQAASPFLAGLLDPYRLITV